MWGREVGVEERKVVVFVDLDEGICRRGPDNVANCFSERERRVRRMRFGGEESG